MWTQGFGVGPRPGTPTGHPLPFLLSMATTGSVPLSRMLPMTESLASAQYSLSLW